MTDTDLLIQNLRRENEALRAELEWKQKEIELARRSSGASMHKCGSGWAYCDGQCTSGMTATKISRFGVQTRMMAGMPIVIACRYIGCRCRMRRRRKAMAEPKKPFYRNKKWKLGRSFGWWHIPYCPHCKRQLKHGQWEWFDEDTGTPITGYEREWGWRCSRCKHELPDDYDDPDYRPMLDYCPYCGAKMDGGANNG